ncbi:MAG: zinc finger MYND domain-containing protein [Chlamydiales bacterium]|nr:zinc finger MYND domain-containing protein [Chlamydiales bacterium]
MSLSSLQSIDHVCPVCIDTQKKPASCGRCFSIFYCSRECQLLDWEQHKTFCLKDKEEIATARRKKCLDIIKEQPESIFRYLFATHFAKAPTFLCVSEEYLTANFAPFDPQDILNNVLGFNFSDTSYSALSHAVKLTQSVSDKSISIPAKDGGVEQTVIIEVVNKAIPVLYRESNGNYAIYAIGSEDVPQLDESIRKMPIFLVKSIMNDFLTMNMARSSRLSDKQKKFLKELDEETRGSRVIAESAEKFTF